MHVVECHDDFIYSELLCPTTYTFPNLFAYSELLCPTTYAYIP
jgi:hypothetical protein